MLIFVDARAGRRGDLNECEAANPLRVDLQQTLDGSEAFHDALCVVETVDTDTELVLGRNIVDLADAAATVGHGLLDHLRFRRPGDGDRVTAHRGELAAKRDGEGFPVDARFEKPIHRVNEIVAMKLSVEAENAAPEQPSTNSSRHGQMANDSGLGQGMCQKVMTIASGSSLANHARQQCEVVVLD